MITKVPEQESFFYGGNWNKARDSMLLRRLISRRAECGATPPDDSPHALICAMESINTELDGEFSYADVNDRVTHLKKRFSTFTRITKLPGFQWDGTNNVVVAMDEAWQRLFKEDHFTQAYYYKAEPCYNLMLQLFAFDVVKEESFSKTVILISDSPVSKKIVRRILSPSSEDEVTSPVVKPPAARELFPDDATSSITHVHYSEDGACASSCASSSPFP